MIKRTDLKGIYGDLEVVEYHDTIRRGAEYIATWKTKCVHCGHEEERRAKNIKRAIKKGIGLSCKAPGCGLSKLTSERAKKVFRSGTENISGAYFSSIRYGAKRRSIPFEITIEDLQDLYNKQEGKCKYTGLPLVMELGCENESRNTGSIDRIDSGKGYVPGNIQWVHKDINNMKMALQEDTFINYCKLVMENR